VILIAGGTGRLGRVLTGTLTRRGLPVRVLTRDPARAASLAGHGIEVVTGDVRDRASLPAAARGADVVVSAVHGLAGPGGVSPATVDYQGNINLIDSARDAGAEFVLVSVVGAAASSPMELVLIALCGCTASDVIGILRKKREPFTGLEVHARGERATEYPTVYREIHLTYRVRGPVSRKAMQDAVNLSKDKYCSVSAMLAKTAKITYNIEHAE